MSSSTHVTELAAAARCSGVRLRLSFADATAQAATEPRTASSIARSAPSSPRLAATWSADSRDAASQWSTCTPAASRRRSSAPSRARTAACSLPSPGGRNALGGGVGAGGGGGAAPRSEPPGGGGGGGRTDTPPSSSLEDTELVLSPSLASGAEARARCAVRGRARRAARASSRPIARLSKSRALASRASAHQRSRRRARALAQPSLELRQSLSGLRRVRPRGGRGLWRPRARLGAPRSRRGATRLECGELIREAALLRRSARARAFARSSRHARMDADASSVGSGAGRGSRLREPRARRRLGPGGGVHDGASASKCAADALDAEAPPVSPPSAIDLMTYLLEHLGSWFHLRLPSVLRGCQCGTPTRSEPLDPSHSITSATMRDTAFFFVCLPLMCCSVLMGPIVVLFSLHRAISPHLSPQLSPFSTALEARSAEFARSWERRLRPLTRSGGSAGGGGARSSSPRRRRRRPRRAAIRPTRACRKPGRAGGVAKRARTRSCGDFAQTSSPSQRKRARIVGVLAA